jgi:hypothetical protein
VTWEELVAEVTARHPLRESKLFGMPCLKRENGKVVAGHRKDCGVGSTEPLCRCRSGLTVKLTNEAARERALMLSGAEPFAPMAQPPVRAGRPVEGVRGNREVPATWTARTMREWALVPAAQSDAWLQLVDEAV